MSPVSYGCRLQGVSAIQTQTESMNSTNSTRSPNTVDPKYDKFLAAWDKTFVDVEEDSEGYEIVDIEGKIPGELEGTLYRNGPNRFDAVEHPYDADGFIASLKLSGGRAFFRSRFVKTAERLADAAVDRTAFRGTFLSQRPGRNIGDLHVKNTSNTNVVCFKGNVSARESLFTFFEAGQPYRLDPETLETIGMDDFAGTTPPGLPFHLGSDALNGMVGGMTRLAQKLSGEAIFAGPSHPLPESLTNAGGYAMTAHPRICPSTGRFVTFNYTMRIGVLDPREISLPPMYTELRFMEFEDPDRTPTVSRTVELNGYAFLHDFALTENHYVIFLNPVTVDTMRYVSGKAPAAGSVKWVKGKPTTLMMIPRDPKQNVRSFKLPASFVFHHAGAYEEGVDLVVDSVHYPSMPAVGKASDPEQGLDPNASFMSRIKRVRVKNWASEDAKVSIDELHDSYLEMVTSNPRAVRHSYVFGYSSDFERARIGIAKINVDTKEAYTWFPAPGQFLLEPIFAPRDQADHGVDTGDGWLICQFFDSETLRSGFFIFDSADVRAGPIAKLWLRQSLPSALHGSWATQLR